MPIQTARPVSISSPSGVWAATGSAPQLSDDSDSTYYAYSAFGTNFNDPLYATIAAASLPVGAALRYVIINVRTAYPTGSPLPTLKVTLLANGVAVVANTITVTASPTTYGVVAAFNLTSAQLANMQVAIEEMPFNTGAFQPAQAPVAVRVYEIIVSVYYATAPGATPTGPNDPVTTTATPTMSWVYQSGVDGSGQAAYQIAVYNDDQYTAGGFSPGQPGAIYDSGVVYNNSTSAVIGPLPNDTYRAYIRVAQLINGQLHWTPSGYWTYKGFVENVTPPSAPTITPTASNTFARIDLVLTGSGNALSVLDVYEIQRTADNGVTWVPVRGDLGQYVEVTGGFRDWSDYESGNGESVKYRARTVSTTADDLTYISAWSSMTSAVSWSSSSSWLKVPGKPGLNRSVIIEDFGDDSYLIPQAISQGLGSRLATVQSGLRRSKADGTVSFFVGSTAERTALDQLLQEPVLLIQPKSAMVEWGSRYVVPGTTVAKRYARGGWLAERTYEMPYTQIEQPSVSAYVSEPGVNTWSEVVAQYATWSAIGGSLTWADIRG